MASNKRFLPRNLTDKEVRELLQLKNDDITLDLLEDFFAYKENSNAKFNCNDTFKLPVNKLYNKSIENTTVGRYIFNLHILFNDEIGKAIGYMNYPMTDGKLGDLDSKLSRLLLDDKILPSTFSEYIDRIQWLGFACAKFLNCSLTVDLIIPPDKVVKKKDQLIKENKKALENSDVKKVVDIEQELINLSKEELKDLPDMDIYNSGARGKFGNNFKNTSLMRGCIKSLDDPTKIDVSTSSLEEGIPPKELHSYANVLTQASYSRAVGTRDGGYVSKQISAALQNVVLADQGTDCHTTKYLKYMITKDNYKLFLNRYIQKGNTLILLTEENKSQFINKVCNIRSPLFCTNERICSKCAGQLYYKLGIKNIGLVSNSIGSALLNSALKAFHDTSIKLSHIELDDFID